MHFKKFENSVLPKSKTTQTTKKLADVYYLDGSDEIGSMLPTLGVSPTPENTDQNTEHGKLLARVKTDRTTTESTHQNGWLKSYSAKKAEGLIIHEKIGQGSIATIYRASFDNRTVAVKIISDLEKHDPQNYLRREAELLSLVKSPYVLQSDGCFVTPDNNLALVLEHVAPSRVMIDNVGINNLESLLVYSAEVLSWEQQWQISWEVSLGIQALHSAQIVHADIKSANILFYADNRSDSNILWHIKICDLGLAHKENDNGSHGTLLWAAPETLKYAANSTMKSDIYAVGLLLWQVVSKKEPYEEYNNKFHFARELSRGKVLEDGTTIFPIRPAIDPAVSQKHPEYAKLIQFCWENDPENRPENMSVVAKALEEIKPKNLSNSN